MAIKQYGPGEHPGGFVGFSVTSEIDDRYLQEHFSTAAAKKQSAEDVYFRYQQLRALYRDTEWEAESLWRKYKKFVNTSRGNTKPLRGLDVHCITASFIRRSDDQWDPCFTVSRPGSKPQKRFNFRKHTFSEAWEMAVTLWADEYEVLDEDRERLLEKKPDPEQFKLLRRQMNDLEGYDIPVEALGPVFKEQRERLAKKRLIQRAEKFKLETSSPKRAPKETEAEILAWFEREREQAG